MKRKITHHYFVFIYSADEMQKLSKSAETQKKRENKIEGKTVKGIGKKKRIKS